MHRNLRSFLAIAALAMCGCAVSPPATTTGADLTFASTPIWTPNSPSVGQQITISCVAMNNGGTAADASLWSLQRDNTATGITGSIPALASGATYNFAVLFTENVIGVHSYVVIINSDGRAAETDTANNTQTLSITFTGPDILAVSGMGVAPALDPTANPTTSTALNLAVTITNASTTTTYLSVPWRIMRDGVDNYVAGTISTVAHGATIPMSIPLPYLETPGLHTYVFTLDPSNTTLNDPVTTNNSANVTVNVAQAVGN